MKKVSLSVLFTLMFAIFTPLQSQIKSGIVIGGGMNWFAIDRLVNPPMENGYPYLIIDNPKKRIGGQIGYQFQFDLPRNFQLETGAYFQTKLMDVNYYESKERNLDAGFTLWGVSIQGVMNYRIIKGLKIGLGFEPTIYGGDMYDPKSQNMNGSKFDCPLVAKLAYDFPSIGFSITYKNGFINLYENPFVYKAKSRDILFNIYIPLTR